MDEPAPGGEAAAEGHLVVRKGDEQRAEGPAIAGESPFEFGDLGRVELEIVGARLDRDVVDEVEEPASPRDEAAQVRFVGGEIEVARA